MPITLNIISYQRLTPGQQESLQTDLERFSVGRNAGNHWTLPDPQRFMSGTHCWLEKRAGNWFITDTSTNGVFINGSKQRLNKNESVALSQGDRIRLGDYELEADLQADSLEFGDAPESVSGGFDDPFLDDVDDILESLDVPKPQGPEKLKDVNTPLSQMDDSLLGGGISIDKLYHLDEVPEKEEEGPSIAYRGDQASPLRQHFSAPQVERDYSPPPVAPAPANTLPDRYAADLDSIPDNWDEETGMFKKPQAKPAYDPLDDLGDDLGSDLGNDLEDIATHSSATGPVPLPPETVLPTATAEPQRPASPRQEPAYRAPAPQMGTNSAMAALVAGAGLDARQLQVHDEEEFFHNIGTLLKIMTEGLMQAVASRGQVKSEFRIEQTMIAPTRNNPLKFSPSVQEALTRLLSQADSAYLSGTAAATEAIADVNTHQMAVLAGTEAALKSILQRFSPTSLESKFDHDSLMGKALPMVKKAKYWESYKILFDEISEAADDDFQQFFGAEFSSAYEKQLDRLKLSRKESSK